MFRQEFANCDKDSVRSNFFFFLGVEPQDYYMDMNAGHSVRIECSSLLRSFQSPISLLQFVTFFGS